MKNVKPVRTFSIPQCHRLIKEGDGATTELFFVSRGSLLVVKGDVIVTRIDAPSFTGEIAPVLGRPRSTSIISKTDCTLEAYDVREFLSKLTIQSDQGYNFLEILVGRFESTRERVDEFQKAIIKEYVKILAELVTSKKVQVEEIPYDRIREIREEKEMRFDSLLQHRKPHEDFQVIQNLARQNGILQKFQSRIATRFRSFAPLDVETFKTPRASSYLNFREAAAGIAGEIVVLTRYMATLQLIDIDRLDHELSVIEETIPFDDRVRILDEMKRDADGAGRDDTLAEKIRAFEEQVNLIRQNPGYAETPLAPCAAKFGLDRTYATILRRMWKELLTQ